jgi:histidinol dehydrogenase
MKTIRYPERDTWPEILKRPIFDTGAVEGSVRRILDEVRSFGDEALRRLTQIHDDVVIDDLLVSQVEIDDACGRVPDDLRSAIEAAKLNIEKFHRSQTEDPRIIETTPGVTCWRKSVAIEKVGLYVPAGTAPLFSTVLMLAVPAKLAGCREIVLCSPPDANGKVADAILFAAKQCGVSSVFKVGGAQAIAAMAYGTESIPRVYKIFGPGNHYVTLAKQLVSTEVAIDMPSGPSEVAVLADESCDPAFVAADLLSQAEHGPDSQVLLVTTSDKVIAETLAALEVQLRSLSRRSVAERSLAHSTAILVHSLDDGLELLNEYAPEHLILAVDGADEAAEKVINAGSVFIGIYACESAGDYASGTNHTLPTSGFAKSHSGVSLDSFGKKITFQKLTPAGVRGLGPVIERLAEAEGLDAHKNAISIRLEALDGI